MNLCKILLPEWVVLHHRGLIQRKLVDHFLIDQWDSRLGNRNIVLRDQSDGLIGKEALVVRDLNDERIISKKSSLWIIDPRTG